MLNKNSLYRAGIQSSLYQEIYINLVQMDLFLFHNKLNIY